jgi:hypothetical protein
MTQNSFQGQDPNQPGALGNPPSSVNPQPPYVQPQPGEPGYYPPQAPTSNPQPYAQQPYAQQPYAQQPYAQPQPGEPGYYPPQAPTGNQQPYAQQPYAQQPYAQQPYAQQPYAQSPYAQPSYTQLQKLKLNPGYLTAGIAGLIGFIAVFIPYFTLSYTTPGVLGFGATSSSYSVSGSQIGGGLAFFDIVFSLAALLVAAFVFFGPSLLGSTTAQGVKNLVSSLNTQARRWIIALIAIGGAGAFLHLIFMLTNGSSVSGISALETGLSVSWGFGAILYLLTMLAVAGGGIWELLRQKKV